MTRKKFWFLHFIGFAAASGTLLATSPALAPEVVGFSAVYLMLTAAGLLLRLDRLRFAGLAVMVSLSFLVVGVAGGPRWALLALALALVTWWPRRLGARV